MMDSSMFPFDHWDLAPGEAISQSPPIGAHHGSRIPRCPAPTLDTQEFNIHHISCEDGLSIDSLAEYDVAPGEVRSQSPFHGFRGSQCPPCPPPTLDTQEFLNTRTESDDVWIVEDSLACWDLAPGEPRSQGPILDQHNTPKQLCPRNSLDTQEFENKGVLSENVWLVEDSLACWNLAPGEAIPDKPDEHLNQPESKLFPSLKLKSPGRSTDKRSHEVPLPSNSPPVACFNEARIWSSIVGPPLASSAGKRSLPSTSPQSDSAGKSKKKVKVNTETNYLGERCSPPVSVPLAGRFPSDGRKNVSISLETEDAREHNLELADGEFLQNLAPVSSAPPKQALPTAVPLSLSQAVANNDENMFWRMRKHALVDITNSKPSEARSHEYNSTAGAAGTSINQTDCCRKPVKEVFSVKKEEGFENQEAVVPPNNGAVVLTNLLGHLLDNGDVFNRNPKVVARSVGKKPDCVPQAKAKVQTSLDGHPVAAQKRRQHDRVPIIEGWQCPRESKRFVPASKQLYLDRWLGGSTC